MADKKIPDLSAAESINLTDLLLLEHGNSTTGFDSQKLVMSVFATWLASQAEFPLLLNTTAKNLIGAINEAAQSGGGGGASILYGTTAPTSAQGSNGSLYIQYSHDTTLDEDTVEAMFFKVNDAWTEIDLGGGGSSVSITPTLASGTKIADYSIDGVLGSLYAPTSGGGTSEAYLVEVDYDDQMGLYYVVNDAQEVYDAIQDDRPMVARFIDENSTEMTYVLTGISDHSDPTVRFSYIEVNENDVDLYSFYFMFTESQGALTIVFGSEGKYNRTIKFSNFLTRTLTAGATTLTFMSDDIKSNSLIDIYTDTWGVNPTNVVLDTTGYTNTLTLTFEAQANDVVVKVELR